MSGCMYHPAERIGVRDVGIRGRSIRGLEVLRDVVEWAGRVSYSARSGDTAEVGEHLARRVHGDGPGLKADHAVRGDMGQLLGAPDGCGGVLAVDSVDGEYRVGLRREGTPA